MGDQGSVKALLIIMVLLICADLQAQVTHLIRGVDFAYIPDTVYMTEGDSIHFDPTNGLHNMTQTEYADWLNNVAITNGGFDTAIGVDTTFVIDTAGTYYFVCLPHGYVGMKGVLIVAPLSTQVSEREMEQVEIFPNPTAGQITITQPIESAEVFDLSGKLLRAFSTNMIDISDLEDGSYLLMIGIDEGQVIRRILKQR